MVAESSKGLAIDSKVIATTALVESLEGERTIKSYTESEYPSTWCANKNITINNHTKQKNIEVEINITYRTKIKTGIYEKKEEENNSVCVSWTFREYDAADLGDDLCGRSLCHVELQGGQGLIGVGGGSDKDHLLIRTHQTTVLRNTDCC